MLLTQLGSSRSINIFIVLKSRNKMKIDTEDLYARIESFFIFVRLFSYDSE